MMRGCRWACKSSDGPGKKMCCLNWARRSKRREGRGQGRRNLDTSKFRRPSKLLQRKQERGARCRIHGREQIDCRCGRKVVGNGQFDEGETDQIGRLTV